MVISQFGAMVDVRRSSSSLPVRLSYLAKYELPSGGETPAPIGELSEVTFPEPCVPYN
jgi:hypothetical protein